MSHSDDEPAREITIADSVFQVTGDVRTAELLANVERARQKLTRRDLNGALRLLSTVLAAADCPPSVRIHALLYRGLTAIELGDFISAIDSYTQVLTTHGVSPAAHISALRHRANAHRLRGDLPQAISDFDDALRIVDLRADERADILVARAFAHYDSSRNIGSTFVDLDSALELPGLGDQMRARVLLHRAAVHAQLGATKCECDDYTLVLSLRSADRTSKAIAHINRGVAAARVDGPTASVQDFTTVVRMPDASPTQRAVARLNRGVAKGRLNDRKAEKGDYAAAGEKIDGASPDVRAVALRNLAISYIADADSESAIKNLRSAIGIQDVAIAIESNLLELLAAVRTEAASRSTYQRALLDAARPLSLRATARKEHEWYSC